MRGLTGVTWMACDVNGTSEITNYGGRQFFCPFSARTRLSSSNRHQSSPSTSNPNFDTSSAQPVTNRPQLSNFEEIKPNNPVSNLLETRCRWTLRSVAWDGSKWLRRTGMEVRRCRRKRRAVA
ncbi:hypothetical protein U1Q18_002740 [Sarracenia purpurea var. burkii]